MTAKSWIRKLFARPTSPVTTPQPTRSRLGVEGLEDRKLMAAHVSSVGLHIDCGGGNDTVAVSEFRNFAGVEYIEVNENGFRTY